MGGHRVEDAPRVENTARAWNEMLRQVRRGDYGLSATMACDLHAPVAREQALEWGSFRTRRSGRPASSSNPVPAFPGQRPQECVLQNTFSTRFVPHGPISAQARRRYRRSHIDHSTGIVAFGRKRLPDFKAIGFWNLSADQVFNVTDGNPIGGLGMNCGHRSIPSGPCGTSGPFNWLTYPYVRSKRNCRRTLASPSQTTAPTIASPPLSITPLKLHA